MTPTPLRRTAQRLSIMALMTVAILLTSFAFAQELVLGNDHVRRVLRFDGHVWRTTLFARADGTRPLPVQSDEFHLLLFDDREFTLDQYRASGEPLRETRGGVQYVSIRYVPREGVSNAPAVVTINYSLADGPALRKTIVVEMNEGGAIDRLEVERFTVNQPASRGGRGEPVFIRADRTGTSSAGQPVAEDWFFGVEYPAFYSRHTDGNSPAAWSGPYDRLGNYSFIDLEGRDIERRPRPGLVRLMHFPGYAKRQPEGFWGLVSKTAVAAARGDQPTIELAFQDYLNSIRRPVRSFVHYNNWYDREGKRLSLENFVTNTFLRFRQNLDPYGVRIDAMVPDDGWQNRQSVYEPNPQQFPRGMDDLAALGAALRENGTQLGLWIALNGYNSNIDWGLTNGYVEAERNAHFRRFRRYYSITHSNYNAAIRRQLTNIIARGQVQYLKHDFNEMCDLGEGRGHPPTDRHGHEASVDAKLELLALEREQNADIYQNITNWIWFSPWWLAHGNNLWMLANDAGEFREIPEISLLVMAAAYRDVHLHRAWSNPATRPMVPISHLMTHGIIYTESKYSGGTDTLRDFADYVMMYYMRGLQLKEWYITPRLLTPEQWEVLGRATRWSRENMDVLANAVLVGGNPARETYGYMAWKGDRGILSVRNPGPETAEITVPFDSSSWYRGEPGKPFRARVVYPYQDQWPDQMTSGTPIRISIPGYSLLVLDIEPGAATVRDDAIAQPVFKSERDGNVWRIRGALPDEAMQRCDLLLISRTNLPAVHLNEVLLAPSRTNSGRGWIAATFDLREFRGKETRLTLDASSGNPAAWIILDRPVNSQPADRDARLPAPVSHGFRRQTQLLTLRVE